jgi:hypothetical protein
MPFDEASFFVFEYNNACHAGEIINKKEVNYK